MATHRVLFDPADRTDIHPEQRKCPANLIFNFVRRRGTMRMRTEGGRHGAFTTGPEQGSLLAANAA
jgi:hypothetical protein